MAYAYPNSDLHDQEKILRLLGSLWSDMYGGVGLLLDRARVRADISEHALRSLQDGADCVSRRTCPVHAVEAFRPLTLKSSDRNSADEALWTFDDPDLPTFDGSPEFAFDEPLDLGEHAFPLDSDVADAWIVTNRLTEPSLVLHKGIDFRIDPDRNAIFFRENPFDNDLVATESVFEDGEVVDTTAVLWLNAPRIEKHYVRDHFGYVLGIRDDSSEEYRDLINAVFDALVGGTSLRDVESVVSAMVGIPLAEGDETVEVVGEDSRHKLVITDKNVYKFGLGATVTAAAGDSLAAGESMVEDYERIVVNRGTVPTDAPSLVIGRGVLDENFIGTLTFENKTTTLDVTGAAGQERVEFDVHGHPLDVAYFWDTVHDRRLVHGKSLHELLAEQPGGVPATINPAEFLASNVLRNNVMVVRVQSIGSAGSAVPSGTRATLRRMIPPRSMLLLMVEMPPQSDSVTMDNVGDDVMGTFAQMESLSESVAQQHVDDSRMTAKSVAFTCQ